MTREELLIVDSSVAIKWFKREDEGHVDVALGLLNRHRVGELRLTAPAHLPVEVLNGLQYSGLGVGLLRKAAEALFDADLLIIPADAELLASAADLASEYRLSLYDALFPALAVRLDCEFVTADRAQARVRECPVRLLA